MSRRRSVTVPVVHAGLGLSVPQTDLHASGDVDSQPALELGAGPQTGLQVEDLEEPNVRSNAPPKTGVPPDSGAKNPAATLGRA